MSWDAVDLDEGLTVRRALKRLPDGSYVIGPPKVESYRTLRLPGTSSHSCGPIVSPAQGAPVRPGVGGPWTGLHQRRRASHRLVELAANRGHLCEEGKRGAPLPQ